jgi:N-acetylneuraminic acid mutarotase
MVKPPCLLRIPSGIICCVVTIVGCGGQAEGEGELCIGTGETHWEQIEGPDFELNWRRPYTAVWTGEEVWFFGGSGQVSNSADEDFVAYSPQTGQWRRLSTEGAPQPRNGHFASWSGGEMVVWGGFGPTASSSETAREEDSTEDGGVFREGSGWSRLVNPYSSEDFVTTVAAAGSERLFVYGRNGGNGQSGEEEEGYLFDLQTEEWMPTSTWGGLAAGGNMTRIPSVLINDDEVMMWGQDTYAFEVGATVAVKYKISQDAWAEISEAGAPEIRAYPSLTLIGDRVFVWGGRSDGSDVPDPAGAIYNPATDDWQAVSVYNAPAPRVGHAVVSVANKVVVFGGDDGGIYDLDENAWSPLPEECGPAAQTHIAVALDSGMLVWGGLGPDGENLNDGAILRLAR